MTIYGITKIILVILYLLYLVPVIAAMKSMKDEMKLIHKILICTLYQLY
jgi:hypothetical protein